MKTPPVRLARRFTTQRGLSLIETMVGLTLGLLVTLIITQVWGVFESQKQRTISGSSAQASGLLALTELEQDIRSAGAGITEAAAFACTDVYSYYNDGTTVTSPIPAYSGTMGMAPVTIVDGGAASDTITVKRSSDILGGLPTTLTKTMPQSSSELDINTTSGIVVGDVILAVGTSGKCAVMEVTQVQNASLKLQHNPGQGQDPSYNPPTSFQNTNNWPAFTEGDKITKIGQLVTHTFTTNAQNELTLTDLTTPGLAPVSVLASDIVRLKAQYGIADAGSQNVNQWVSAAIGGGWDAASLTPAKIKRIKAVRLVIVARSSKLEGTNVTATCTNVSGGVNNGPCAWVDTAADPAPVINLSADANWRRYRYRTYQTIIPIRNVIWAGV